MPKTFKITNYNKVYKNIKDIVVIIQKIVVQIMTIHPIQFVDK